jgi:hypothetical protein
VKCNGGEATLVDDGVVAGIVSSRGGGCSKKREHVMREEVRGGM